MSMDIGNLTSGLRGLEADLQAKFNDPDIVSDPAQLLKLQMDANRYQQISGLATAILDKVKQTTQNIISKI